jgi:hypothetical protein
MARERCSFGEAHTAREGDADVRVPEVVSADALAPLAVEARGIACGMYGAQDVATAVRSPGRRREEERLRPDAPERDVVTDTAR